MGGRELQGRLAPEGWWAELELRPELRGDGEAVEGSRTWRRPWGVLVGGAGNPSRM